MTDTRFFSHHFQVAPNSLVARTIRLFFFFACTLLNWGQSGTLEWKCVQNIGKCYKMLGQKNICKHPVPWEAGECSSLHYCSLNTLSVCEFLAAKIRQYLFLLKPRLKVIGRFFGALSTSPQGPPCCQGYLLVARSSETCSWKGESLSVVPSVVDEAPQCLLFPLKKVHAQQSHRYQSDPCPWKEYARQIMNTEFSPQKMYLTSISTE